MRPRGSPERCAGADELYVYMLSLLLLLTSILCVYIYIYTCMYVCMYIYIYIYIYTYTRWAPRGQSFVWRPWGCPDARRNIPGRVGCDLHLGSRAHPEKVETRIDQLIRTRNLQSMDVERPAPPRRPPFRHLERPPGDNPHD